MSVLVTLLPVYYKQRARQFFPPWAFAMPPVLLRIPYTLMEVRGCVSREACKTTRHCLCALVCVCVIE